MMQSLTTATGNTFVPIRYQLATDLTDNLVCHPIDWVHEEFDSRVKTIDSDVKQLESKFRKMIQISGSQTPRLQLLNQNFPSID